jgi:hypothetical protein
MYMIFILIQIKFDIDINNDELLKTTWKHFFKKNLSSLVMCSNMELKSQIYRAHD